MWCLFTESSVVNKTSRFIDNKQVKKYHDSFVWFKEDYYYPQSSRVLGEALTMAFCVRKWTGPISCGQQLPYRYTTSGDSFECIGRQDRMEARMSCHYVMLSWVEVVIESQKHKETGRCTLRIRPWQVHVLVVIIFHVTCIPPIVICRNQI
jgi:hypothetical protein